MGSAKETDLSLVRSYAEDSVLEIRSARSSKTVHEVRCLWGMEQQVLSFWTSISSVLNVWGSPSSPEAFITKFTSSWRTAATFASFEDCIAPSCDKPSSNVLRQTVFTFALQIFIDAHRSLPELKSRRRALRKKYLAGETALTQILEGLSKSSKNFEDPAFDIRAHLKFIERSVGALSTISVSEQKRKQKRDAEDRCRVLYEQAFNALYIREQKGAAALDDISKQVSLAADRARNTKFDFSGFVEFVKVSLSKLPLIYVADDKEHEKERLAYYLSQNDGQGEQDL